MPTLTFTIVNTITISVERIYLYTVHVAVHIPLNYSHTYFANYVDTHRLLFLRNIFAKYRKLMHSGEVCLFAYKSWTDLHEVLY
jgi:hypothetical protein